MKKQLIIVGLDLETTGLDAEKGHRITEVGANIYKFYPETKQFERIGRISKLINPKRSIPVEVQQLTGITPDMVKDADTWNDFAPALNKVLNAAHVMVAHNVDFDRPFLEAEFKRIGFELKPQIQSFCTMQEGRFATPLGKVPKLQELCWSLDVEYDPEKAHRAIYDVDCMMQCLEKGLNAGYYDFAPLLEKINVLYAD